MNAEQMLVERLRVKRVYVCLEIWDQFLGVNTGLWCTSGSAGTGCEQ